MVRFGRGFRLRLFFAKQMHHAGVSCGDRHDRILASYSAAGMRSARLCHSPAGSARLAGLKP